ncbi:MAG: hypothetical protein HQ523_05145 [Lentisphaerae bacterium]|nr:hypothetical protein [Lentisphaerota bacterium]
MRLPLHECGAAFSSRLVVAARSESSPYWSRRGRASSLSEPLVRWMGVLALMVLALAGGCASVRPCGDLDVGFIASRDTSPEGAARFRAAGPFVETQDTGLGQQFGALRPFYSVTRDADRARSLHEILWPVGSVKYLDRETDWRFLLAYGHDFDHNDPDSRYRAMLFPLVFWGRDQQDQSYFSVFPLGGTLNEFLGRDRIVFALFPLYAYSRIGTTETTDYLWPIVSRTCGEDVSRFRVFPFYGRSTDEGEWTKQFVFWPIWTHARYYDPKHGGSSYVLFPLYGRTDMVDQQGWSVLPPLIRWAKSDQRTQLNCPWPFIQYVSGDYEKLYIWPLWGRREMGGNRTSFLLWPFVHTDHIERSKQTVDRFSIFPFIYHERVGPPVGGEPIAPALESPEAEVSARYFKLWPLLSYQRDGASSRVRCLELWPLKHTAPIERNLTPLWTLYSRVATPEQLEHELLWGLFRYRREGETGRHLSLFPLFSTSRCEGEAEQRSWSFLLGLLGHERDEARSTWRLLWFLKFGD